MAADCEQIRGRMLELLYGELPAEARAEVQAHVAGCAACRAELAALESTRALARRALAADAPPPRARAAILQAAAAAARARPAAVVAPSKPSFWASLRGRWTFPTFATIGAVAIFLLASRIFLEPEKTYQRGRAALAPAEAVPTAAAPAPERMMEEQKRAEERVFGAEPATASRPAAAHKHAKATASEAGAPAGGFAPPPPPRLGTIDQLLDEAGRSESASEKEARPAKKASRGSEGPPPAAAPARARPQPAFAPAPPAAAPPAPPAPAAAAAETADRAPRGRAKAEAPRDDLGEAAAGSGAAAEPQSPAARADRLFAQHRWAEAATAYRQLLRDDPTSPSAARWRQRIAACEAAQQR